MRFKAILIGTNEMIEVIDADDEYYMCRTASGVRRIHRHLVQPLDARETE